MTQAYISIQALPLSSWDAFCESFDHSSLTFLICQMEALSAL